MTFFHKSMKAVVRPLQECELNDCVLNTDQEAE